MANKKDFINYDLSEFDKDVVAYIGERLEGVSANSIPKEAFQDPAILVNTLVDDSYKGVESFYPEKLETLPKAMDYLNENMEEICGVLDMSSMKDNDVAEKFSTLLNSPQDVIINVYAEEAKQLLSSIPFYANQEMRKEQANERLSNEDLKQISADLEQKPYKRNEAVVQFHGTENGNPYVIKFDYKETKEKANQLFNTPEMEAIRKEVLALADNTASSFRVMGPKESIASFNTKLKGIAKDFLRDKDISKIIKEFQKDVQNVFHAEGIEITKTEEKTSLKINDRTNSKERTLDRVD